MVTAAVLGLAACAAEAPSDAATTADPVSAAPATPAEPAGPSAVPLPPNAPRVEPGPVEPLEVQTARGPVRFDVEIADSPGEREQGLMWRGSMPADHGMLFDFGAGEAEQAFWMRNTYIPLDILYVRRDGRIHSIARNATPLSEAPIPSGGPVFAVLEINGGLAERLGINPGDVVRHRIFGSPVR